MLEKEVEAKIVRYAKDKGVLTYKFSSPQQRGVPDRLFLHGGIALFMEVKRAGKQPTKLQLKHMERIREAGHYACWVDNPHDGKIAVGALANGDIKLLPADLFR